MQFFIQKKVLAMVPEKILNYKNEKVIKRFINYYEISVEEAEKIFEQMKLFLFVSNEYFKETGKRIRVVDELFVIDEMWHYFILFTEDYYNFCHDMFNSFYHHIPTVNRQSGISISELRLQMEYIQNKLGFEILNLWYSIFSKEYSALRMYQRYIVQTELQEVQ